MSGDIPVTPPAIEPVTFLFVALCLNKLHHRVHEIYTKDIKPIINSTEKFSSRGETELRHGAVRV
jgi:hypothetical protein